MHRKLKLIAIVAIALTYNQNVWAKPIIARRQYDGSPPEYGPTTTPSYESPTTDYGAPTPEYGGEPDYGKQPPTYGKEPDYGKKPPTYGEEPDYGKKPPTYGTTTPTYGTTTPTYGTPTPKYGEEPEYGTTTPTYGTPTPKYGEEPEYGEPEYGEPGEPDLGPFKLCDDDQDGTVEFTKIDLVPIPIIPGEYMTLTWEGYSESRIQDNSKLVVTVRVGEHDIDPREHDICKVLAEESGGKHTCPIPPGNFSESVSQRVPEDLSIYAGEEIIIKLNATNGDGSLLYCLEGTIPIGSASSKY